MNMTLPTHPGFAVALLVLAFPNSLHAQATGIATSPTEQSAANQVEKEHLTAKEQILMDVFWEMFSTRTSGGEAVVDLLHKYGFVHKGPYATISAGATPEQSRERLRGLSKDLVKLAKSNWQAAAIVGKFNLARFAVGK